MQNKWGELFRLKIIFRWKVTMLIKFPRKRQLQQKWNAAHDFLEFYMSYWIKKTIARPFKCQWHWCLNTLLPHAKQIAYTEMNWFHTEALSFSDATNKNIIIVTDWIAIIRSIWHSVHAGEYEGLHCKIVVTAAYIAWILVIFFTECFAKV